VFPESFQDFPDWSEMLKLSPEPLRQPCTLALSELLVLAVDVLLVPDVCASAIPAASKNDVRIVVFIVLLPLFVTALWALRI